MAGMAIAVAVGVLLFADRPERGYDYYGSGLPITAPLMPPDTTPPFTRPPP